MMITGCAGKRKAPPPKKGSLEWTRNQCSSMTNTQPAVAHTYQEDDENEVIPYGDYKKVRYASMSECMEETWPSPIPLED